MSRVLLAQAVPNGCNGTVLLDVCLDQIIEIVASNIERADFDALDPKVMGDARALAAKYFPGVPAVPIMANGYTDATFLGVVGISTYSVAGAWGDPDGNGVHGLNERIEIRSLVPT